MATSAKSWADLPVDLLVGLVCRLEDPLDVIRCGAVCRSWRSATVELKRHCLLLRRPRSMIPWVVVRKTGNRSTSFCFYRLADKKTYSIPLPQAVEADAALFGPSLGFIVTIDRDANLHIANPITGFHSPLPPTLTFPDVQGVNLDPLTGHAASFTLVSHDNLPQTTVIYATEFRDIYFLAVAVAPRSSWTPSTPSAIIVAAFVVGVEVTLAIATPGDASWTPLPGCTYASGIIFHKGRLLAVHDHTLVYDPNRPTDMPIVLKHPAYNFPPTSRWDDEFVDVYLVESQDGEELLMVIRRREESLLTMRSMVRFVVYKLLSAGTEWKWVQVKDIGEFAVFLGRPYSNSSVLVLASSRELQYEFVVERNCIYFSNDAHDPMTVFHLEDESFSYTDLQLCEEWWSPMWFTPLLL